MTDKLLPAGTYVVTAQAVGGAFADGGLLSLHLAHAMVPDVLQLAAANSIDVFLPKELEMLPAGAWWHVSIAYHSSLYSGCMMAGQQHLTADLQSEQFTDALRDLVPRTTAAIAFRIAERIGIAPPPALEAERPVSPPQRMLN